VDCSARCKPLLVATADSLKQPVSRRMRDVGRTIDGK
jgi:hypothetical protein